MLGLIALSTAVAAQQPISVEQAYASCLQHTHLVGTGPVSARTITYDTGWEHCVIIEASAKTARVTLDAARAAERIAPPDINVTKDIANKIQSGEIK